MPPSAPRVRYSPLPQQFENPEPIFDALRALVASGDFTLGYPVREFEAAFAKRVERRFAIGVNSGTDALKLPLKAVGVGPGDEVITCANTFYATAGAITELGAIPRLVDCAEDFNIDPDQIEAAIGPKTKAIMPVHLTGDVCDMDKIMAIADRHGLPVIEDGCQSLTGVRQGRQVGGWGVATGFSMHPLKIINVWGDAGVIVTDDPEMDRKLRLLRNHGLRNRDEMEIFGCNSRLDSLQAVVGSWMLERIDDLTRRRIENAAHYDAGFQDLAQVETPKRLTGTRHVYLLYMLFAERRDELLAYTLEKGIEAKIHYPIPLYQQKPFAALGYRPGMFPVTDRHARTIISFPVDQHLERSQLDYVIDTVKAFYRA